MRRFFAFAAAAFLLLTVVATPSGTASAGGVGGFGSISGRIRVNDNGTFVGCTQPQVIIYPDPDDGGPLMFATGASNGTYDVSLVPAGDHMVVHYCAAGDWILETFRNQPGFAFGTAELVHVIDGIPTTQINSVLEPGGGASGTIVRANGSPVPECKSFPWAVYQNGNIATLGPCPNPSDGTYALGGSVGGVPRRYNVQFPGSAPFVGEWFNNKASQACAKLLATPPGTTKTGIDAVITPQGPPACPPPTAASAARANAGGVATLPNGLVVPTP